MIKTQAPLRGETGAQGPVGPPGDYISTLATGGRHLVQNEGGWVLNDLTDAPAAATTEEEAVYSPLIAGENLSFVWGESKAVDMDYVADALEQIVAFRGETLPSGATVAAAFQNNNSKNVDEIIALQALMKTEMDAAFTAGAECVSFIGMLEQANDMLRFRDPALWEASMRDAMSIIRTYAARKYVGTVASVARPIPPVFMILDCTYGKYEIGATSKLMPDIPLWSVDMADRIPTFGIAAPDYICEFLVDQRHYTTDDKKLMCSYLARAWYEWCFEGRKYKPTRVVESWRDGTDFYLRCEMPQRPLVADTALVDTIADWGLVAKTAGGIPTTISGLEILGGDTIHGTTADSLAGGGWVQGGLDETTANSSGKANGARTMLRDSSDDEVDFGAGAIVLHSPLLPFRRWFT